MRKTTNGEAAGLVIVGSGRDPAYWRYLVEQAVGSGHPIWLASEQQLTWERPLVRDAIQVDFRDLPAGMRRIRAWLRGRDVAGVFCFKEAGLRVAARLAEYLGRPGPGRYAVDLARDKTRLRMALDRFRIRQPRWMLARSHRDLRAALERFRLCVVKLPTTWGGEGVCLIEGMNALKTRAPSVNDALARGDRVLVEEFLDAPEIAIEGLVVRGRATVVASCDRVLSPLPYFLKTRNIVPSDLPLERYVTQTFLQRVVKAMRIDTAAVHLEVKIREGDIWCLECTPRLAGDLMPLLVGTATGCDIVAGAISAALGEIPIISRSRDRTVIFDAVHGDASGVVRDIRGWMSVARTPGIIASHLEKHEGDVYALPPRSFDDRLAFIVAEGASREEAVGAIDRARSDLRFHIAAEAPA